MLSITLCGISSCSYQYWRREGNIPNGFFSRNALECFIKCSNSLWGLHWISYPIIQQKLYNKHLYHIQTKTAPKSHILGGTYLCSLHMGVCQVVWSFLQHFLSNQSGVSVLPPSRIQTQTHCECSQFSPHQPIVWFLLLLWLILLLLRFYLIWLVCGSHYKTSSTCRLQMKYIKLK